MHDMVGLFLPSTIKECEVQTPLLSHCLKNYQYIPIQASSVTIKCVHLDSGTLKLSPTTTVCNKLHSQLIALKKMHAIEI